MAGKRVDTHKRFWDKVRISDGCWEWTASCSSGGYGQFCVNGHYIGAHVASYLFNVGGMPEQMFVCHSCDNPPCVRPSHLFLGTSADNLQDMAAKGRWRNGPITRRKLSLDLVPIIMDEWQTIRRGDKLHFFKRTAEKYGCSSASVQRLVYGATWRPESWKFSTPFFRVEV